MSTIHRLPIRDTFGLGGFRGVVIFGNGRHQVHKMDPFGRKTTHTVFEEVTHIGENIVPIGGYQFAFDKIFNIAPDQESTLRVGDLNDEAPMMRIGVDRADYKSIYYNGETSVEGANVNARGGVKIPANNFVFGFMVGNGASREDNTKPIAPDYKQRTLYNAVPFRMSNDQYPFEAGMYFGKSRTQAAVTGEEITSYYVKAFDNPKPHIIHSWVTDDIQELQIVDDTVFASTSSQAIESYVEMNFTISKSDVRGYFTTVDADPRVNEFALVSGWYNADQDDYECLRLFTKFCRPSINLSDGDEIKGVYRLYAR